MPYDSQKHQELKEARKKDDQKKRQEKEKERKEKAQRTLKKYSTGKKRQKAKKNMVKNMGSLAKNASSPLGFFSLIAQANLLSDWMYGLALIAAILKDLLDLTEVTGILYLIIIVATFLCSIFIAMMMILDNYSSRNSLRGGHIQQKMIRSWLVLLGGTTLEMIFGLDFLPIETLTVLIIYALALSARVNAKKALPEN